MKWSFYGRVKLRYRLVLCVAVFKEEEAHRFLFDAKMKSNKREQNTVRASEKTFTLTELQNLEI